MSHEFNSNCIGCRDALFRFNDDMILRSGLPKDVFELIHDIAYHTPSRDVLAYMHRAQQILKTKSKRRDAGEKP